MYKYVLTCILAGICAFTTLNHLDAQEIIESTTIEDVLPLIDEDTWFVLDLDNTVFQAKQALGHVNWLQHEVQVQMAAGKSQEEAFHTLYPLWKKTQMITEVIPVEGKFVEGIKQLQEKDIVVIGLTHRQPFIIPETIRQLDSLGISFLSTAPSNETINIATGKLPAMYKQGILFVNDFNSKGEVFRSLLAHLNQKPKKIVFIDDKKKNVEEMAKAALIENIEYIDVHYTAVDQGPQVYDRELAKCQLKFLNKIMSNEEALLLLSSQQTEDEVKMNSTVPEYLYKIVSKEQWQESLVKNRVVVTALDEDFIHLAKEDQVAHVVNKFWNGKEPIILKLATKKLVGHLVFETNPGGTTQYYHLYDGSIPLEAVSDVTGDVI